MSNGPHGAGKYEGSQDWLALSRKKFAAPQPNDEAELEARLQTIFEDFMMATLGMKPAKHNATSGYVREAMQLYQSHTRQLEQRVLEARPAKQLNKFDGQDYIVNNDYNQALDDWSTNLKGVSHG